MAVITISNTGGNWNSTGTWVGGVIPTTSDSILATATSGQLTVNVNVSILFMNLSLYTSTLTINSLISLTTTGAGSTSTLGSGMSYSFLGAGTGQGKIVTSTNAQTYTQNGTTRIPNFQNATTVTITSNLYLNNLIAQNSIYNGGTIYVDGNITNFASTSSCRGTSILVYDGTGTFTMNNSFDMADFQINTSGTLTFNANFGFGIGNVANSKLSHIAGTIVNPFIRIYPLNNKTLQLQEGTYWEIYYADGVGGITQFDGTNYISNMVITSRGGTAITSMTFQGTGTANIKRFEMQNTIVNATFQYRMTAQNISINPSTTINIADEINIQSLIGSNQLQTPSVKLLSTSPGTPAIINVNTYNQSVSNVAFTDIDCSGGNTLYGQNLTLSNTTNITQYTLPPSGGGGETSSVFIS